MSTTHAAGVLEAYAESHGTSPEESVRDLITELAHHCDTLGICFMREMLLGFRQYHEESRDLAPGYRQ